MIPYIDMHCDTLMGCFDPAFSLRLNNRHVDLTRLHQAGALAQCFAVFLPQRSWFEANGHGKTSDEAYIRLASGFLQSELAKASDVAAPARTAAEIDGNRQAGRVSALLTMEDGRAADGKIERIDQFYQMGFRMIAPLWNHENCFGYPNSGNPSLASLGLKPFGCEAIERMNELGMLVDVSHLNDGGFQDVAALVKGPFVASHSNARALSPHPRNLTDEQLRALGEHGGVTGVNFYGIFLQPDGKLNVSTIERMVKHVRHIVNTAGIESVGIGSDLDGIGGELEIDSTDRIPLLLEALIKDGFSEDEVERFAWKNVFRVWKEVVR